MVREAGRRLGPHEHPEITMSLLPMGPTLPWWDALELDKIDAHLRATAQRLADAGCDFFVCPDNTAHIALDAAREAYPLPGLHICDVVAERAKADGRKRIALLGTRYTMQGPAYPAALARRGLEMRAPGEADQELLNRFIFDELCLGEITETARAEFLRVIEGLKDQGCDAVALSCTEIPLIVTPEVSPLPTLDSTRLLAHAAIDVALNARPLPVWRGGLWD
jgi:aspartate racemase